MLELCSSLVRLLLLLVKCFFFFQIEVSPIDDDGSPSFVRNWNNFDEFDIEKMKSWIQTNQLNKMLYSKVTCVDFAILSPFCCCSWLLFALHHSLLIPVYCWCFCGVVWMWDKRYDRFIGFFFLLFSWWNSVCEKRWTHFWDIFRCLQNYTFCFWCRKERITKSRYNAQ